MFRTEVGPWIVGESGVISSPSKNNDGAVKYICGLWLRMSSSIQRSCMKTRQARAVHEGGTAKANKGLLHLFIIILFDFFFVVVWFCLIKLLNQSRTDCILTGHCSALGDVCWTVHFRMQLKMREREKKKRWLLDCESMSGKLLSAKHVLDIVSIRASIFSKFIILNQRGIHGCWGFYPALGSRSKRKTGIFCSA